MFGAFLQGAIGLVIGIAGSIIGFGSLLLMLLSPNDAGMLFPWMLFGFIGAIGGGYARYLSVQTIRVGDSVLNHDKSNNPNKDSGKSFERKENISFEGEKNLENDSYQLHLVKKYNIEKNDVLNKYVLKNNTYENLTDALKAADELEKKIFFSF